MVSTIADLDVWARALATGSLLSPAMQRERLEPTSTPLAYFTPLPGSSIRRGLSCGYGLGIFRLGNLLGHNGELTGFTADMFYLPAKKATIIVLANGDNAQFDASNGQTVTDAVTVSMARIVLHEGLGS